MIQPRRLRTSRTIASGNRPRRGIRFLPYKTYMKNSRADSAEPTLGSQSNMCKASRCQTPNQARRIKRLKPGAPRLVTSQGLTHKDYMRAKPQGDRKTLRARPYKSGGSESTRRLNAAILVTDEANLILPWSPPNDNHP